ncbi:ATPase, T2SS/T4P/T4SS family [Spirillospora sp. NPDC047279]|uniref:CpaF family protein n=1 Tax=Spirillospora sp. NPDC047279 TaxID=3155478 RepID=UPI00340364E5
MGAALDEVEDVPHRGEVVLPGGFEAVEYASGVRRLRWRLREEIDLDEVERLPEPRRRPRLERVLGEIVNLEGPVLTAPERAALIRQVIDEEFGLGPLEPLLADRTVTAIMVNGARELFVERGGLLHRVSAAFSDDDTLLETIERITGQDVGRHRPTLGTRLAVGERVTITMPPVSAGPTLTIRRFRRSFTLDELVLAGAADAATVMLLGSLVRARLTLLVTGGPRSGTSTFLNAAGGLIPPGERVVTVEETAELRLAHDHVVALEGEDVGALAGVALGMRPDRLVIGEVRPRHARHVLETVADGMDGVLMAAHARGPGEALRRWESPGGVPAEAVWEAVDAVVHLERGRDGVRRIGHAAAVDHEARTLRTFTAFEPSDQGFVHSPLPRETTGRIEAAGESVPTPFA